MNADYADIHYSLFYRSDPHRRARYATFQRTTTTTKPYPVCCVRSQFGKRK